MIARISHKKTLKMRRVLAIREKKNRETRDKKMKIKQICEVIKCHKQRYPLEYDLKYR